MGLRASKIVRLVCQRTIVILFLAFILVKDYNIIGVKVFDLSDRVVG